MSLYLLLHKGQLLLWNIIQSLSLTPDSWFIFITLNSPFIILYSFSSFIMLLHSSFIIHRHSFFPYWDLCCCSNWFLWNAKWRKKWISHLRKYILNNWTKKQQYSEKIESFSLHLKYFWQSYQFCSEREKLSRVWTSTNWGQPLGIGSILPFFCCNDWETVFVFIFQPFSLAPRLPSR